MPEFVPEVLQRRLQNPVVIVGQSRYVVYAEPVGIGRREARAERVIAGVDKRVIGQRNHPFPRIPIDITEGAQLFQIYIRDAGQRGEQPVCRVVDTLVIADPSTRKRPLAFADSLAVLDQQNFQSTVSKTEDQAVNR